MSKEKWIERVMKDLDEAAINSEACLKDDALWDELPDLDRKLFGTVNRKYSEDYGF